MNDNKVYVFELGAKGNTLTKQQQSTIKDSIANTLGSYGLDLKKMEMYNMVSDPDQLTPKERVEYEQACVEQESDEPVVIQSSMVPIGNGSFIRDDAEVGRPPRNRLN